MTALLWSLWLADRCIGPEGEIDCEELEFEVFELCLNSCRRGRPLIGWIAGATKHWRKHPLLYDIHALAGWFPMKHSVEIDGHVGLGDGALGGL